VGRGRHGLNCYAYTVEKDVQYLNVLGMVAVAWLVVNRHLDRRLDRPSLSEGMQTRALAFSTHAAVIYFIHVDTPYFNSVITLTASSSATPTLYVTSRA
jgi:hypothetical protein